MDFPVQSGDLTAKIKTGPVAAVGIPGALGTRANTCIGSKVLVQGMHYDSVVGLLYIYMYDYILNKSLISI